MIPFYEPGLEELVGRNYRQERIKFTTDIGDAIKESLVIFIAVGTPPRGDGSADLKPIAHLYKTQVYALARYLELPEEICNAQPTTDTYSMAQGQDEFYFALPYDKMDIALLAYNRGEPSAVLAAELDISAEQVEFIYRDIEAKRKTTAVLHWPAIPVEAVSGPNTKPPMLG